MRIATFDTGGVGGYFGGLLAHAGHSATFITRGEHLRAMCQERPRVRSVNGDLNARSAQATNSQVHRTIRARLRPALFRAVA